MTTEWEDFIEDNIELFRKSTSDDKLVKLTREKFGFSDKSDAYVKNKLLSVWQLSGGTTKIIKKSLSIKKKEDKKKDEE